MKRLHRLRPFAMPLAYLVFTLLVYWKLWTPIDGARGSWRYDPRYEYWGDLIFQHETLSDGVIAMWNPFDRGGFPVYGDPQPGLLYPPNWLFAMWGAAAGGVPYVAITIKILLHWVLAAVGMHLFLRRLGAAEPACYLGGVLMGWTCPKIRYAGSALNWSVAWIPWLLLATWWFAKRPDWRRGAVLGSTLAMVLLSGAPAVLLYALVLAAPYGLYELRGKYRSALRGLLVAAGVSLLWVLPLVLSNLEQLPASVRETRDLAFVTDTAFSPAYFAGVLIPRLGGENLYYGLLALLCMGALVGSSGRARALLFLGTAAFGVALALGNHAGFMGSIASALPPFGLFRRAHRYLYITSIAVAALAGLGFAHVLRVGDGGDGDSSDGDGDGGSDDRARALARRVLWIGGAIAFALGIAYLVSIVTHDKMTADKNTALGLAVASAAISTWLLRAVLVNRGRRRRVYAWIAVAFVAADMWTANAKVIAPGFTPLPETQRDGRVAQLADLTREVRVYDRGYLDYRPGTRLQIRDFGGYEDDPLGLSRYAKFLARAKADLRLLGHANVRYYLDGGNRRPRITPKSRDGFTRLDKGVWEAPAVAPAVMYVPTAKSVADVGAALSELRTLTPGQGAVVEAPQAELPTGPEGAAVTAGRITSLEPNRVVAEIETPGPGLVVIAEAYYPAWTATVDGASAPIWPANAMFRGIPVDRAGTHRIEMRLRPLRFWLPLPGYLAALGLLVWIGLGPLLRRRREPPSRRPKMITS